MDNAGMVRVGVVQPRAYWGDEAEKNVDEAVRYIAQAGAMGVDIVLFPETYPGPYTERVRYDSIGPVRAAAAQHGVAVVAGTTTETAPGSGEYYVEAVVTSSRGEEIGRYRRTHPVGPFVFPGGAFWDVNYKAADDFPIFDMGWGKIGVVICSEVFYPEIARTLALKGAELCFFPTGIVIDELRYTDNWRTVIRARAIENVMYAATTIHLFPPEFLGDAAINGNTGTGSGLTAGSAMIATPERVLAQSCEPGIITADLDFPYLRQMRADDEEICVPSHYRTIPGLLRSRRPELFGIGALGVPSPAALLRE